MKTPHAILIGLTLIAAALFFREPSVPPAQAGLVDGVGGFQCWAAACVILHGDQLTTVRAVTLIGRHPLAIHTKKWRR